MTSIQEDFIFSNFSVKTTYETDDIFGSGFDVVVWEGLDGTDYEGQTYVSLFLATITQGIKVFDTESFSENINIRIPDGIHMEIIPGQYRHATTIYFNIGNELYITDCPSKIYNKNICNNKGKAKDNSNIYITNNGFLFLFQNKQ